MTARSPVCIIIHVQVLHINNHSIVSSTHIHCCEIQWPIHSSHGKPTHPLLSVFFDWMRSFPDFGLISLLFASTTHIMMCHVISDSFFNYLFFHHFHRYWAHLVCIGHPIEWWGWIRDRWFDPRLGWKSTGVPLTFPVSRIKCRWSLDRGKQ